MVSHPKYASGSADLSLYSGKIPTWLFQRMVDLAGPMVESLLLIHGKKALLERMADPFWFQSFGAVIGMDWNSSGVTTAVLEALKQALNPRSCELGIFVCGGKGIAMRETGSQIRLLGDRWGIEAEKLARASKLTARVDQVAVQDGYNLYLHAFLLTNEGDWTVVQQGMKPDERAARRYHWHSGSLTSFVDEPHTAIVGAHQGYIINLVDRDAAAAQQQIVQLVQMDSAEIIQAVRHLSMSKYAVIQATDLNVKRLTALLQISHQTPIHQLEDLLLQKGVGPRSVQALALVSEVIFGTPTRFSDPARFAFAHGGKAGKPYPIRREVYDETINTFKMAVQHAKLGQLNKIHAWQNFAKLVQAREVQIADWGVQSVSSASSRYHDAPRETNPPNSSNQLVWKQGNLFYP